MWSSMGVSLNVWKEVGQSSRSNNRSFVYLRNKESGVKRERESGVEADGDDGLKERGE